MQVGRLSGVALERRTQPTARARHLPGIAAPGEAKNPAAALVRAEAPTVQHVALALDGGERSVCQALRHVAQMAQMVAERAAGRRSGAVEDALRVEALQAGGAAAFAVARIAFGFAESLESSR